MLFEDAPTCRVAMSGKVNSGFVPTVVLFENLYVYERAQIDGDTVNPIAPVVGVGSPIT